MAARQPRLTAALIVGAALALIGVGSGPTAAQPAGFPDVDAYPPVDPAAYQVHGTHPSGSGWEFTTPSGLTCSDSLIPDLGVRCLGAIAGAQPATNSVAVSLTTPGRIEHVDTVAGRDPARLLPTGSKIDAGNGVVCAVPADDALACVAKKPDSWSPDTADPPDRHYGEHGFVVQPAGSWTY